LALPSSFMHLLKCWRSNRITKRCRKSWTFD